MGKPAEPAKPVKPVNLVKPAARPPKPESNEPVKTDESIDDKTLEKVLENILVSILLNFFPSLLTTRPNKLECLYLAITFKSSLTFAGNTRSLPKKEASERHSNWVGSSLALKF